MEKGYTKTVLDKGFVRLIDWMGSDQRICESARISYRAPSKGEEQDKKLINYLYKNAHTSPLEQVNITFNIKLPLFVQAQLIRHRTARVNQVSARYTEMKDEFYYPDKWRKQDTKNKQSSIINQSWEPIGAFCDKEGYYYDFVDQKSLSSLFETQCKENYNLYKSMINSGVAREMARMVLPQNLYTEIYWNIDLNNLLKFFRLRDDSHAQFEIQEYAKVMKEISRELFPWTLEAYDKFKWKAVEES